jgi:hypothetical protein
MERRTGFEPATSRVANEVTAIFTTARDWVGGERSMLLLPSSGGRFTDEVTDIFTTACRCFRIDKGYAGEQAISASVTATQVLLSECLRCGAWRPLAGAPPQCVRQRRESNPLFQMSEVSDIFTTSIG